MFARILTILAVLTLALMAYVRLAPSSVDRWHRMPESTGPGDYPTEGSFRAERRITSTPHEVLTALEQRALATPRTTLLAGGANEGMITFVTRTRLMGFPDYTTVAVHSDLLVIYGRLRFGRSDLGVNRARVLGWLDTLGPLTEPL